jgi:hypothetical protein
MAHFADFPGARFGLRKIDTADEAISLFGKSDKRFRIGG